MGKKAAASPQGISFKSFKLDQAIFELRFRTPESILFKHREFWETLIKSLPENKISSVDTESLEGGTVARYGRSTEIRVWQDRVAVASISPEPKLAEYFDAAEALYKALDEVLGVELIHRAGVRIIWAIERSSLDEIAADIFSFGYMNVPNGLSLEGGNALIPVYACGWRDEEKAVAYRLTGQSGQLKVNMPLRLSLTGDYPEEIVKSYNQTIFDVDVFIHKATEPGAFFINEWMTQAYEVAKEDAIKFLGE
jgi:hypothetical protein